MDLLRHIPVCAPRRIADVYKERGSMRALLACRFPHAKIEAFDLSRPIEHGLDEGSCRLSVEHKFDLICLNGAGTSLRRLLPMLVGMVSAGGCLAVEFPNDLYEPNRALMRMIAADGPWAEKSCADRQDAPVQRNHGGLICAP